MGCLDFLDNNVSVSIAKALDIQLIVAAVAAGKLCNAAVHGVKLVDLTCAVVGKLQHRIFLQQLENCTTHRAAGKGIFLLDDDRVGVVIDVGKVDGQGIPHIHIGSHGAAKELH